MTFLLGESVKMTAEGYGIEEMTGPIPLLEGGDTVCARVRSTATRSDKPIIVSTVRCYDVT